MSWTRRTKYFEVPGSLYPYEVRHHPTDRAFLERERDGRLRIRVQTQPELVEAVVVIDTEGTPLEAVGRSSRFTYWQGLLEAPPSGTLEYTLAFRDTTGVPLYISHHGVAGAIEGWEPRFSVDLGSLTPIDTPDWVRGAVIYQIFPDRFAEGDPTLTPEPRADWGSTPRYRVFQGGDLVGIVDRLDYLADLGVDALYLNPIFTSPSTHKYDAADFFSVDPALGGDDALRELVAEAHRRSIRIVLDVAFDHAHPSFEPFQDVLTNGPDSEYADWFTVYDWPPRVLVNEAAAARHYPTEYFEAMKKTLRTHGLALATRPDGPPVEPTYRAWNGVPTMPQLDLENPETRAYVLDAATYWISEFDIDGWRMDVAREPSHGFWRDVRQAVRAVKPDTYLLAEIWGDTSAWLQGDQFDATMNYTFRDLCVGYFADRSFNTDVMVDGIHAMLAMYANAVTEVGHNLLGSHDVERFLHLADGSVEALGLATLFQLTMPGVPGIYYGDEVALGGGKDPDNRAAFPWERVQEGHQLIDLVKALTTLRRAHPALQLGSFRETARFEGGFAFVRRHEDEQVLVVINNRQTEVEYELAEGTEVLFGEVPLPPMTGLVARLPRNSLSPE